ncbi:hypothetical protein [Saccharopolyspora taberi]|uniref:hypothetical protein n=1 Tax=Saccharopolyspora taberi TaxID=60895 RepID=UPI0031DABF92
MPVAARILAVVRTPTALDRLHDVFPALADDVRLEIRFAVAKGSEFAADLTELLHRQHMRVVKWSKIRAADFDLAISPSSNGALHKLRIPIMTMPHGAGHHKKRATGEGFTDEISGLSRTQLVHKNRIVPKIIGLSHHNQIDALRAGCPEAVDRARVIGDPCFDRLRASIPMRDHYRSGLRSGDRKLVVICSTWGDRSAYGRQAELVTRLVEVLPPDHYQVALVLHPNIPAQHSRFMVDLWTRHARSRGLVVVPPDRGWRAVLVAADVVVSDHGSLALYAAALGIPFLLAEFGTDEIVPGTPAARLADRAAWLDPTADLRAQVDAARPVAGHEELASDAFSPIGRSAERLREAIYDAIGLPLPGWPVRAEPVEVFSPDA